MSKANKFVIMVGAFPPPVHGMAAVNAAMREVFRRVQGEPEVINLAAPSLDRSLRARIRRLPAVARGLVRMAIAPGLRDATFYLSVSGGLGQFYDLMFVILARLRRMPIFLHHHTFAYLDRPTELATVLFRVAGASATHITLSQGMAVRLKKNYRIRKLVSVSNAVFFTTLSPVKNGPFRDRLRTLGFISNVAPEKGVFEFLDLMAALQAAGLPIRAKLAGPFQDRETEKRVRARLKELPTVDYVGPKYGADKDAFFASIDVLIFPTRYVNEAEPLTLHEAMSRAISVITYGRGCIPEIVREDCGLVIDLDRPFLPVAFSQVKSWLADPAAFKTASKAAAMQFAQTYTKSQAQWQVLLGELTGNVVVAVSKETGESPFHS